MRSGVGAFLAGAGLTLFASALLVALRPQTVLALPVGVAMVAAAAWRLRPGGAAILAAFLVPLLLSTVLLWLPGRILARDAERSGSFTSGVLFFWHFDLVLPVLQGDGAAGRLDEGEAALVASLGEAYAAERERHVRDGDVRYRARGFNPDKLFYGKAGAMLLRHFADARAYDRFALGAFLRAVARDPSGYARKVITELRMVYRVREPTLLNPGSYVLPRRLLAESQRQIQASTWIDEWEPGRRYRNELEAALEAGPPKKLWLFGSRGLSHGFAAAVRAINALHLPLLLAGAALSMPLRRKDPARPLVSVFGASALLAFGIHAASAGTIALQLPRYVYAVAPVSLFCVAAALLLLLTRALEFAPGFRSARAGGSNGEAPHSARPAPPGS